VKATFGPPRKEVSRGGAFVSVYLVPEWDGQIVAFDIAAKEARGRWVPWTVADYGASIWETASALGDEWCGDTVETIDLVDTISLETETSGWELALIFRARLKAMPDGETGRIAVLTRGDDDRLSMRFAAADMDRWIAPDASVPGGPAAPQSPSGTVLF